VVDEKIGRKEANVPTFYTGGRKYPLKMIVIFMVIVFGGIQCGSPIQIQANEKTESGNLDGDQNPGTPQLPNGSRGEPQNVTTADDTSLSADNSPTADPVAPTTEASQEIPGGTLPPPGPEPPAGDNQTPISPGTIAPLNGKVFVLQKGVAEYKGVKTANIVNDTYLPCTQTSCDNSKMRTDNDWDGVSSPAISYQEGLIHFSDLPALPEGAQVQKAILTLWFYPGHTCRHWLHEKFGQDCPAYIDVFALVKPWSSEADWWNDGLGNKWEKPGALMPEKEYFPALRSTERVIEPPCGCTTCFQCPCPDRVDGHVEQTACMTKYTCFRAEEPLAGGFDFEVTDIVKAWYSAEIANNGFVIRGRWGLPAGYSTVEGCHPHVEFYFAGMNYQAPGSPAKNLTPRLQIEY